MPKPPTSVRSIRLTDELWATIQADADARGEKVNGVISRHLRVAYAPKNKLTVENIVDVTLASSLGASAMASVNRTPTAPPSPLTKALNKAELASVPAFVRKSFNPQPKTGKK